MNMMIKIKIKDLFNSNLFTKMKRNDLVSKFKKKHKHPI